MGNERRPYPPFSLWCGVLLADWCVLLPMMVLGLSLCMAIVSCSPTTFANFWVVTIPTVCVLVVFSTMLLLGWRYVRWFYFIFLAIIVFLSLVFSKHLLHDLFISRQLSKDSIIPLSLAVTGLVLSPCSIFLLASKKTACYLKGNEKYCPRKS